MSDQGYKTLSESGYISEYDAHGNFIDAYPSKALIEEDKALMEEMNSCHECNSNTGNPCSIHG